MTRDPAAYVAGTRSGSRAELSSSLRLGVKSGPAHAAPLAMTYGSQVHAPDGGPAMDPGPARAGSSRRMTWTSDRVTSHGQWPPPA